MRAVRNYDHVYGAVGGYMLFLFLSSLSSVVRAEPVQFRTVMFYDLQQDCDPVEVRFGACIEELFSSIHNRHLLLKWKNFVLCSTVGRNKHGFGMILYKYL